jgi:hypothetical protein
MNSARKTGVIAALLTAIAGFGVLCVFWFLGSYDPSVPGLFDYRSATVGDGLLLPLVVGILAGGAISLKNETVPHRAQLTALAAIGGGATGVAVIWRWHEDPNPDLNWTWPAPHDFNGAGWAHSVFLVLAGAAVAGLLVNVLLGLRARNSTDVSPPFWGVALVAWGAVGVISLILRDNQAASGTDAALATAFATIAAALVAAALALWISDRRMLPAMAVGVLGGLGTFAYCFEWPPQHIGVTMSMPLAVIPLAFALTEPLESDRFDGRLVLWAASGAGAAGALALGVGQVVDERLWTSLVFGLSAVVLLVGSPIAFASKARRCDLLKDLPGTVGVSAFIAAALMVAAWLAYTQFSQQSALATLSAIELTFDLLVFTLFRERFRQLVDVEAKATEESRRQIDCEEARHLRESRSPRKNSTAKKEAEPDGGVGYGAVTDLYSTLYMFAFAALATIVILLGAAADPIGLNDVVKGMAPERDVLLAAAAVLASVIVLGAPAIVLSRRRARRVADGAATPELGLDALAFGLAATAALASVVTLGGGVNRPALAAAAALVYSALVIESLIFSPLRLQLDPIGPRRAALIAVTGLAVFTASFWLFSAGVWSNEGPAEVWRIGVVSALVLGGCLALSAGIGVVLAQSGSGLVVTPSGPAGNAVLDQVLYALFMFLIGVFPITAIAQIDVSSQESFALVSSLMFVPGLFGAFVWVIDNNSTHHRAEQERAGPWAAICEKAGWEEEKATDLLNEYRRSMRLHSRLQNWGATSALVAALILLAIELMGH